MMLNVLTIFIIAPLILLVLVGVMLSVYNIKHDRSAKLWVAGCLCLSAGYVFAAMRSAKPGDLSYVFPFVFSNIATILGVFLTFIAFEKLLNGKDRSIPLAVFISIVFGLGLGVLLYSPLRSGIGVVVGLVFGLLHLYFVYRIYVLSKTPNIFVHVLIVISFVHGALWIFRGVSSMFAGFHLISSQTMTNVMFVLIFVMLSTARQLIYVLLRLSTTSEERRMLGELNEEKNKLISSLLKVNKTVATGALSATVAHEVNQPLATIKLTLAFLRLKSEQAEMNRHELIKELLWLEREVDRASDTIKTLRSVFQEDDVMVESCDLDELIEFVLHLSSYDLNKRKITLIKNIDENCWVSVNKSEMRQVLINVIGNASDALLDTDRTDKTITLTAKVVDDVVVLDIADNGHGINPEYQSEIFELLHTHKPHGTGLGLWLCRALLDRHKGTIEFKPSPEGGAMFTIRLPRDASLSKLL